MLVYNDILVIFHNYTLRSLLIFSNFTDIFFVYLKTMITSIVQNPKTVIRHVPSDPILYQEIKERVKSAVARWPSAYASGMLVKQYKTEMARLGKVPYIDDIESIHDTSGLRRWFDERWIDIKTGKPCGSVRTPKYYPTCRPSIRVSKNTPVTSDELDEHDKTAMIQQKQKAKYRRVVYEETKRYK